MKRIIYIFISSIMVIIMLSACATTKGVGTKEVVAPEEPRWHTLSADNVMTDVTLDGKTYSMTCSFRAVRDSMVIVSVKPLLGIELYRLEATPKSMVVIDKINSEYIPIKYSTINLVVSPNLKYADLQAYVAGEQIGSPDVSEATYSAYKHIVTLRSRFQNIRFDEGVRLVPFNLSRYREVTIQQIMKR